MSRDTLANLVGDAHAKVTVSYGLKDSDFGTGFDVFCSVTLSCNQDDESVLEAQQIAQALAATHCEKAVETGRELFESTQPSKKKRR